MPTNSRGCVDFTHGRAYRFSGGVCFCAFWLRQTPAPAWMSPSPGGPAPGAGGRILPPLPASAYTGSSVDEPFDGVPCTGCGVTHSAPRNRTMRRLGLQSSTSNVGSAVAVAFGPAALGVDIEAIANVTPAALSLALTSAESASLSAMRAADRSREAARYWTFKEAT